MGIHIVGKDGKLKEYKKIPVDKEEQIEDFIEEHPEILEDNMFIIGRQVQTSDGAKIDLMGMDKDGDLVIVELKKDKTPREVVSQILEYAVWAENIQYEQLNEISMKKHIKNHTSLMKKFENDFNSIPEFFNENQRLYIVSELIDEKTENVTRYLKTRGIDISCIELNFHENVDEKLVDTRVVVGNEKIVLEEYTKDGKKKKLSWDEKLKVSSEENAYNIEKLIELIKQKFDCFGEADQRWYYFYIKEFESENVFCVLLCGKHTANIAIRIDPKTFDEKDENVRELKGWWFKHPSQERRISITPENYDLILRCLEHSFKITQK